MATARKKRPRVYYERFSAFYLYKQIAVGKFKKRSVWFTSSMGKWKNKHLIHRILIELKKKKRGLSNIAEI